MRNFQSVSIALLFLAALFPAAGDASRRTVPLELCRQGKITSTYTYFPQGAANWVKHVDGANVDGRVCEQFSVTLISGWGGGVWEYQPDAGDSAKVGLNLSGAKKLTFFARGAHGGETVTFSYGVSNSRVNVNSATDTKKIVLTPKWREYSFDLNGRNLSLIRNGFSWWTTTGHQPVVFYIDDVRYS